MTTRLTNERKNYLKSYARRKLGLRFNTPLKKILSELTIVSTHEITEDLFYPYMEEYVRLNDAVIREELNTKVQADRVKKDAINAKRREKARLIREAKKVVKMVFRFNKPGNYSAWRDIFLNFYGKSVIMSLKNNDGSKVAMVDRSSKRVVEEREYDVPSSYKDLQAYFRNMWYSRFHWRKGSGDEAIIFNTEGDYVEVSVGTIVSKKPVVQSYAEGGTNCLLTPIKNWIQDKLEEVKNKRSREKYITMRNKVDRYLEKYTTGVPQNELDNITNDLHISISIELPFQTVPYLISKPETKSQTTFKFMNTRYNHVDELIDLNDRVTCTNEELSRIMTDMDERGLSYYYTMSSGVTNRVYSSGKIYETSNKYSEFISKFEKTYHLHGWKIDAITQPELTRFLTNSCHYNEMKDVNNVFDKTKMRHIDQEKCYKNYKACKFYTGFLSKITDFRVTDKFQGPGIYQITNIVISDPKFKKWNDLLNIYVSGNSYPSPALNFLDTVGSYTILGGCWGVDSGLNLDYDIDESSFTDKDNGVPYYSKYIGSCNHISYVKAYNLNCTVKTAECIRTNTECEVKQYGVVPTDDPDTLYTTKVYTKKIHSYHMSQVTSYILEYARLNIIEQLMTMPYESVVRINSDGIYYVADEPCECVNNYCEKPSKCFNKDTGKFTTYYESNELCSNTFYEMPTYSYGPYRDFYMSEIAVGGGGSGKTHFNLTDSGLVSVMYIAPSWKLCRNKAAEYGCRVGTHSALLQCDPTNDSFKFANVLILDEVSMLTNEAKDKILNFYGMTYKIIFCGDIKYQLPPITEGTEFNTDNIDNVMTFDVDYRAQCSLLKQLKNDCRELMDRGVVDCPESVFSRLKPVNSTYVDTVYKIDDMILCQYNITKKQYSDRYTGRFGTTEKYYITKTGILYSTGEIIISNQKPPAEFEPEIRHAFTVHSIQGETCKTNLFIHKARMSMRMFYTAISRAQSLSQIFLILN